MSGKAQLLPFFTEKQSRNEFSFTQISFTIMHYLFIVIMFKPHTHTHTRAIWYIIYNASLYYVHINRIYGFQGMVLISTTAEKDVVAR